MRCWLSLILFCATNHHHTCEIVENQISFPQNIQNGLKLRNGRAQYLETVGRCRLKKPPTSFALILRGGRGLAPDPEDESEVGSDWILPEEVPKPSQAGHANKDSSEISGPVTESYHSQTSEEEVIPKVTPSLLS